MQAKASQFESEWCQVSSRNQHNKQLQEKSALKAQTEKLTLDISAQQRNNAVLVAYNRKLQSDMSELSQSLHEEKAKNVKSKEQLHAMQNSLSMQNDALASKDRHISQVIMLCMAMPEFCAPWSNCTAATVACCTTCQC